MAPTLHADAQEERKRRHPERDRKVHGAGVVAYGAPCCLHECGKPVQVGWRRELRPGCSLHHLVREGFLGRAPGDEGGDATGEQGACRCSEGCRGDASCAQAASRIDDRKCARAHASKQRRE
jgi:hypothetical protein